jgi:subtilisin family serine protease
MHGMGLRSPGRRRRLAPLACGLLALTVGVAALGTAAGATVPAKPNDPLFAKQWGLAAVGAPAAWATSTGAGTRVGVVDTGVDLSHQDLVGQIVGSTDCVGSSGNPLECRGTAQDDNGHGTEVAGIIAAATNNGLGIAGTAPEAKLLVAKAISRNGAASIEDINAGIEWVVDHGASVVDLSLGDPSFTFTSLFGSSIREGIEYAWANGAIPVLAAGNAAALGLPDGSYAGLDAVVVGSVSRNGAPTGATTPPGDAKWAVMAPGGSADGVQADDILSTYWVAGQPNSYGYLSGTSMATPFVAGGLALLVADALSPQDSVDQLLSTAVNPRSCGPGSANCRGTIDLRAAMAGLAPAPPPTTTVGPVESSRQPTLTTAPPATRVSTAPPVGPGTPAVMRPTPTTPSHPATPTTAKADAPPRAPANAAPPGRVVIGLTAAARGRTRSVDVGWIALMAALFGVLVAGGIVRVMRAPPPEGLE